MSNRKNILKRLLKKDGDTLVAMFHPPTAEVSSIKLTKTQLNLKITELSVGNNLHNPLVERN